MIVIYHWTSWLHCKYKYMYYSCAHMLKLGKPFYLVQEPLSVGCSLIFCKTSLSYPFFFSKVVGLRFTMQKGKQLTFRYTKKQFYTRMSRLSFPIRFWSKNRDLTKIRWWCIFKISFTFDFSTKFTKIFPKIFLIDYIMCRYKAQALFENFNFEFIKHFFLRLNAVSEQK